MRLTRRMTIVSLMLSILGLGQPTLADPLVRVKANSTSSEQAECSGGISQHVRLGGEVVKPTDFNLSKLQSLPPEEVTVSFGSAQGQETHTYVGVPLWKLIQSVGGLKPNPDPTVKNGSLRQYIVIEATDCYQIVLSEGEIDPNFEGKQVLVAYATKDDPSGDPQLLADQGIARIVVPGDLKGGRNIYNIRRIKVFSAPDLRFKSY